MPNGHNTVMEAVVIASYTNSMIKKKLSVSSEKCISSGRLNRKCAPATEDIMLFHNNESKNVKQPFREIEAAGRSHVLVY